MIAAVRYTAVCPCGNADATWVARLVPVKHELSDVYSSIVVHEVECDACAAVEVAA